MGVETDLRTYLLSQSPVTTLVGAAGVYCGNIEDDAADPVVCIKRVSGGRQHTLTAGAGFASPRIQLDVYSQSYVDAKAVAEAVRGEMQGFKGTWGSTTVSSVVFENEVDLYEEPDDGTDLGWHHIALDYFVRYSETVPTF